MTVFIKKLKPNQNINPLLKRINPLLKKMIIILVSAFLMLVHTNILIAQDTMVSGFQASPLTTVTFRVSTPSFPSGMSQNKSLFLTGNSTQLGEWNPAYLKLQKRVDLGIGIWETKIILPLDAEIEYNYTLGSWVNCELTPDKKRAKPRKIKISKNLVVTDHISEWPEINQKRAVLSQNYENYKNSFFLSSQKELSKTQLPLKKDYCGPVITLRDGSSLGSEIAITIYMKKEQQVIIRISNVSESWNLGTFKNVSAKMHTFIVRNLKSGQKLFYQFFTSENIKITPVFSVKIPDTDKLRIGIMPSVKNFTPDNRKNLLKKIDLFPELIIFPGNFTKIGTEKSFIDFFYNWSELLASRVCLFTPGRSEFALNKDLLTTYLPLPHDNLNKENFYTLSTSFFRFLFIDSGADNRDPFHRHEQKEFLEIMLKNLKQESLSRKARWIIPVTGTCLLSFNKSSQSQNSNIFKNILLNMFKNNKITPDLFIQGDNGVSTILKKSKSFFLSASSNLLKPGDISLPKDTRLFKYYSEPGMMILECHPWKLECYPLFCKTGIQKQNRLVINKGGTTQSSPEPVTLDGKKDFSYPITPIFKNPYVSMTARLTHNGLYTFIELKNKIMPVDFTLYGSFPIKKIKYENSFQKIYRGTFLIPSFLKGDKNFITPDNGICFYSHCRIDADTTPMMYSYNIKPRGKNFINMGFQRYSMYPAPKTEFNNEDGIESFIPFDFLKKIPETNPFIKNKNLISPKKEIILSDTETILKNLSIGFWLNQDKKAISFVNSNYDKKQLVAKELSPISTLRIYLPDIESSDVEIKRIKIFPEFNNIKPLIQKNKKFWIIKIEAANFEKAQIQLEIIKNRANENNYNWPIKGSVTLNKNSNMDFHLH